MAPAPHWFLPDDPDVLPAVRELLTQRQSYQQRGASKIAEGLFYLRYMNYRPHEAAVEAALETLMTVEGDLLL